MTIKPASESEYSKVDWIPTGIPNLDAILGGGVPTKRITEISGPYSVGKTTLSLTLLCNAQQEGRKTLLADAEWAYDDTYTKKMGVDTDKLFLIQEKHAEDVLELLEEWASKNKNALIVLDAVGALHPRAEAEKEMGGKTIGGQAGLVAKFCRKIVPILAINNNALVVINHQFTDIMSGKLKTSGGEKLSYHKSLWLSLRKTNKYLKKGEATLGIVVEAEVKKTKMGATQNQKAELQLVFGEGFVKSASLMQEAIEKGIFKKTGQFWFMGEEKIARGDNALREALKSEELQERVKAELHEK